MFTVHKNLKRLNSRCSLFTKKSRKKFDFNSPAVSHQCTGGQGANLLPRRMIHLTITIYSPLVPSNGFLTLNITTVPINRDIARISNKSGNPFLQEMHPKRTPRNTNSWKRLSQNISCNISLDLSMRNFSLRFFGRGCWAGWFHQKWSVHNLTQDSGGRIYT